MVVGVADGLLRHAARHDHRGLVLLHRYRREPPAGARRLSVAFPSLAVFAVLRVPLDRASDMISSFLQAYVFVVRIDRFLHECEMDKYQQLSRGQDDKIGFEGATLKWFRNEPRPAYTENDPLLSVEPPAPFRLRNLRIDFVRGGLDVVFGPHGAGKSSLLLALLGEMELLGGRVHLPRGDGLGSEPRVRFDDSFSLCKTTAYCPQQPWVQNKTVRKTSRLASRSTTGAIGPRLMPSTCCRICRLSPGATSRWRGKTGLGSLRAKDSESRWPGLSTAEPSASSTAASAPWMLPPPSTSWSTPSWALSWRAGPAFSQPT